MKTTLRITMPNGDKWDVPMEPIYKLWRKDHTSEEDALVEIGFLIDWATNNLNWSDVEPFARIAVPGPVVDLQEGWVNGRKELL